MIIYVFKRMCLSSHSRSHAPGDGVEKLSRGSYVQIPIVPEEWDESPDQDRGVAL